MATEKRTNTEIPKGWDEMSPEEKAAWVQAWMKTVEVPKD